MKDYTLSILFLTQACTKSGNDKDNKATATKLGNSLSLFLAN